MAWERKYMYYDSEQADRVLKGLKRDGVKVKMTRRKLDATSRKLHKVNYVYSIYRWRL